MPDTTGGMLSHYRLMDKIGMGGMGVVWRATDTILGRIVAIKVLQPDAARDEKRVRMFLEEARLASSVSDAHVVQVYELGSEGALNFIVMEYVHGTPLNEILHGRPLPPERITGIGLQVAQALSRVHLKGLLHRDIKPANILVTPEEDIKLVDFGLATLFASEGRHTDSDTLEESIDAGERRAGLFGTPAYMSPEQVRGEILDGRSDIFSLAVVLFEMATGQRPFSGSTWAELSREILKGRPAAPHELAPRLPLEMERILLKALAPNRAERYQTMGDLAVDLRRLHRELESGSSPSYQDLKEAFGTPRRRFPWKPLLSGSVILVSVCAAAWLTLQWRGYRQAMRTVLVMPLEVRDQKEGADYVGWAFAEAIAVNLAQARTLRVLPVARVARQTTSNTISESTAARNMGAGRLLTGSLMRRPGAVHASLSLVDTTQDKLMWGTQRDVSEQDLPLLATSVARDMVSSLGAGFPRLYDYVENLTGGPEMSASPDTSLAIGALRRDELSTVLAATGRLIQAYPGELDALALRTYALLLSWERDPRRENRESLERSLAALDHAEEGNPYSQIFHAYLAQASDANQRVAIELLTRVLARDDLSPAARAWAFRARSLALQRSGDGAGALQDAEQALRLDPANAAAYSAVSGSLKAAGRDAEAVARAGQAVALRPTYWRYHLDLGQTLGSMGRWDESLASHMTACQLSQSQEVCALFAVAQLHAGHPKEAASEARKASSLPSGVWGNYNLACFYALSGRRAEALKELRLAYEGGFADELIGRDPDLSSLHGDQAFEAIVTAVGRRLHGQENTRTDN